VIALDEVKIDIVYIYLFWDVFYGVPFIQMHYYYLGLY